MAIVPTLSADQVAFFEREGYLTLRAEEHGLADPSDLARWTDEVFQWPLEKGKWMPYDEINTKGERQIMRTEKITDYHAPLAKLLCGDAAFSIIKQLTGKDALLFKDKINYKLPAGSGFVAHIDAPSYTHMGSTDFAEIMVAVEPQTLENGCMEVVPGSHKRQVSLASGGRVDGSWESSNSFTPLLLNPGDMLIFGSVLVHRSGPNLTGKRRAAVFGTYHFQLDQPDLRERYYAHRRTYFPPDHEREKNEGYQEGWTMFAYSSPFTRPEVTM
ncbi:hypothetical protein F4859DRAFT_524348 [Xylaria cf. heliscus]|nr:hypothetical protein F4859DRAFT_524348 [Xylaria cf. heliscus]